MHKTDDHLRTFFYSFGPALNCSGLEATLQMPFRTLRWWLAGKRDMPEIHRPKLEAWARRYGYNELTQYDQFL